MTMKWVWTAVALAVLAVAALVFTRRSGQLTQSGSIYFAILIFVAAALLFRTWFRK